MAKNIVSRCKPLLGTYVEIEISGNESRDRLLEVTNLAFAEIARIESIMSFHKEDSELSYINHNAHKDHISISSDMETVIAKSLMISSLSHGLYDISIVPELIKQDLLPEYKKSLDNTANWQDIILDHGTIFFKKEMSLDLGGIGKGYAVDKAFEIIEAIKIEDLDFTINAGGDMRVSNWQDRKVNIQFSASRQNMASIAMQNYALATSATYNHSQNKSAIINNITKTPILHDNVISVFADNCMLADALTKIAFIDRSTTSIIENLGAITVFLNNQGQAI